MHQILVCLHGWGGTKESFTELRIALKDAPITVLTPDLPGFGSEPEPKKPWTTDDYADWVGCWIKNQLSESLQNSDSTKKFSKRQGREGTSQKSQDARKQAEILRGVSAYVEQNFSAVDEAACIFQRFLSTPIHLLGHSHGGRIALKLAYRQATNHSLLTTHYSLSHLYLCAAAGIRHPRHFRRIIGLTLAKTGKFLLDIPGLRSIAPLGKKFLYRLVRVHDYEQASPVMRQTLINVSAEDLRPLLRTIDIPTDIFWGEDDRMTPFSDALIMEREIRGSCLHSFEDVRHRVHRDRAAKVAAVIESRMGLT